jgi:hypothetical protein
MDFEQDEEEESRHTTTAAADTSSQDRTRRLKETFRKNVRGFNVEHCFKNIDYKELFCVFYFHLKLHYKK